MNINTNQKGFTIVELLIVIVVIAILAAISIVAFTGVQNRARASSASSLASQVAKKADAYYAVNSSYPTSLANFAATPESNLEGASVTIESANLTTAPTDTAFTNGTRVSYRGTSTGYTIWYWTNETSGPGVVAANLKALTR